MVGRGNSIVPVIDNIYFKEGIMTVTNLETTLQQKVDIKEEGLILHTDLQNICKKLGNDQDVDLKFQAKSVYVFIDGVNTFKFQSDNIDDFPKTPDTGVYVGDIDGTLLRRASKYTSTDQLRLVMTGVFIDSKKIVATDAHRLFFKSHGNDFGDSAAIISASSIKCMENREYQMSELPGPCNRGYGDDDIEAMKKKGKGFQRGGYMNVAFSCQNYTIITRIIEGTYPEYEAVIPENNPISVVTKRKELLKQLELSLLTANKTTYQVVLDVNIPSNTSRNSFSASFGCKLSSEDLDFNSSFSTIIEAKVYDGQTAVDDVDLEPLKIRIGFNGQFMIKILQDLSQPQVDISMSTPDRAMILDSEVLLMPVMLNK